MSFRVGHGYDIHSLAPGRRLVLGGVEIEHEVGLVGHSDADVAAHAVIDALLGAAALGDIGTHFPDDDEQYKDADSMEMLWSTAKMLKSAGWKIGNVDVTVIAERPKLARYISVMRANLAGALGIEESRISVKATSNEGLDAVGEGRAIAAQAVALLVSED